MIQRYSCESCTLSYVALKNAAQRISHRIASFSLSVSLSFFTYDTENDGTSHGTRSVIPPHSFLARSEEEKKLYLPTKGSATQSFMRVLFIARLIRSFSSFRAPASILLGEQEKNSATY